ncbi:S-adenosyl-L-methionine-dependent methyltransferase [Mariannaea sp. PMI_226]|nr:S-adenosyl-L-methionine-dependent methyltransferase [Mariannaea sp. PMI_226]
MDILASVKQLALAADDASRGAIIDQLNHLARELESPQDCLQRLLCQSITLSIVRSGCDLGVFSHLVNSDRPLSSAELAGRSGSSPLLLSRLLRYLASADVVGEIAPDNYTATNTTRILASPDSQSTVYHLFDVVVPCVVAMPEFLKDHGFADVSSAADCAFNRAHRTEQSFFEWLPTQVEQFAHFNRFMRVQREGMATWLDVYPFLEAATAVATGQQRVLFVDVGGGVGHQAVALRRALPADVEGRIVVQDQAPLIAQALPCKGVEQTAHDFFTPQPVVGARIYYMRSIMHDWDDDDAVRILGHLRDAMVGEGKVEPDEENEPPSLLLIDDVVLPESATHWHAAQMDVIMMAVLAARERTMAQWEALLPRAGLQIRRVFRYIERSGHSVIECVRVD